MSSELKAYDFDGGKCVDPRRCFYVGKHGVEIYYRPSGRNASAKKEFVGTITRTALRMALDKIGRAEKKERKKRP